MNDCLDRRRSRSELSQQTGEVDANRRTRTLPGAALRGQYLAGQHLDHSDPGFTLRSHTPDAEQHWPDEASGR